MTTNNVEPVGTKETLEVQAYKSDKLFSTLSFVLGIIGLLLGLAVGVFFVFMSMLYRDIGPYVGFAAFIVDFVISVAGIVFGVFAIRRKGRTWMIVAGILTSVAGTLLSIYLMVQAFLIQVVFFTS